MENFKQISKNIINDDNYIIITLTVKAVNNAPNFVASFIFGACNKGVFTILK
tara:strand:- start:146 stop:301 length:156 start_codon:yes stop_codon:yes gene_type:complete